MGNCTLVPLEEKETPSSSDRADARVWELKWSISELLRITCASVSVPSALMLSAFRVTSSRPMTASDK